MKEKIRTISSWHELVDFVEDINPNKETVVLVGWLNEIYKERTYVKQLVFSTMDVNILKEKNNVKKTKKLAKKLTVKRTTK